MYQPHFYHSFDNEMKTGTVETSRSGALSDLGDLPLIVLSQGYGENNTGLPDEQFDELRDLNMEMQHELAGLSGNSELVIAEESGHYIHLDQPELVVDAIQRVMELNSQD
jgi:hypothetical protein